MKRNTRTHIVHTPAGSRLLTQGEHESRENFFRRVRAHQDLWFAPSVVSCIGRPNAVRARLVARKVAS